MGRLWKNEDLLTKAAITSDTNSLTGGVGLSTEEADRFLDYVIDEGRLKDKATIIRMGAKTKNIDEILLDSDDVIVPATAVTDPGETVGVNTEERQLIAREGIVVARIGDDALDDSIEGDAFADHVMKMVGRAIGTQLAKILMLGVRATTPVVGTQLIDGWYKRALDGGHVVDGSGFDDRYIDRPKLSALLKSMPNKYLEDGRNPAFISARHIKQDYVDYLASRDTALGDQAAQNAIGVGYAGIPIEAFNTIPTNQPVLDSTHTATTVDGTEAAGQTTFSVDDATGLNIGDKIVIGFGTATQEVRTITGIAGNDLTIAATTYAHTTLETVQRIVDELGTFVMLTEYANLLMGVQREITIETDRLPRLRATDWVITLKFDAQLRNPDEVAVLRNLKVRPAA